MTAPDDLLGGLLRDLARPEAFPDEAWGATPRGLRQVEVVQTHISVVFLTATRAYKVKKPLSLWGFLDYATPAARQHWCREEVRLNRRLAPDVYLGVAPVLAEGGRLRLGAVGESAGTPDAEHAVVMRRFRAQDTLEARLGAGRASPDDLRRLGRLLGAFHRALPLGAPGRPAPSPEAFAGVLRQNVAATRAFVPRLFPAALHGDLERRFAQQLAGAQAPLARRRDAGRFVDGHGDVRLEHVLVEGSALAVIDCVEFTTSLRHIDACSDAAFLVMDLLTRGRDDLARAFALAWMRATRDAGDRLWGLYVAYRAHVRAKVDATTSLEPEVPEAQRAAKAASAQRHLALAASVLRLAGGRPALVLLRGPSGTGKSVLGAGLAPWLRAVHLRSDVVRKELHGLAPLARPAPGQVAGLYGAAASARTYAALLERGLAAGRRGRSALLDATWLRRDGRREALERARAAGLATVIVDVEAPPELVRERLRARQARGDDASDADVAVYEEQLRTAEPVLPGEAPCHLPYAAGSPVEPLLLALLDGVARQDPPAGGGWGATPCLTPSGGVG